MKKRNPRNVKQAFFNNLPSHLVIDILSRLPVRTIICCKCVHKSWLHLIETEEVVKSHLSNSVPGLLAYKKNEDGSVLHRFYEFNEETDDTKVHKLHYNPATPWFDIPCHRNIMIGSANGLLFWHDDSVDAKDLFICNPITREYIKVACAQDFHKSPDPFVEYGFGASKISGQYKVFRTSRIEANESKFEYHVYTLGTGSWRRIHPSINNNDTFLGPFVFANGNLHSLSTVSSPYIFSLDLETELFGTSISPLPVTLTRECYFSLFAMWDSLCLCETAYDYKEITVWLAKENRFWQKEFVFRYNPPPPGYLFCPFMWLPVKVVKVFKDGDILVEWLNAPFVTRLEKKGTWHMLECWDHIIIHTPNYLSLKSFKMENVISF